MSVARICGKLDSLTPRVCSSDDLSELTQLAWRGDSHHLRAIELQTRIAQGCLCYIERSLVLVGETGTCPIARPEDPWIRIDAEIGDRLDTWRVFAEGSNVSLMDLLDDFSRQTRLKFELDRARIKDAQSLAVTVCARGQIASIALDQALVQRDLGFEVCRGRVIVTTRERAIAIGKERAPDSQSPAASRVDSDEAHSAEWAGLLYVREVEAAFDRGVLALNRGYTGIATEELGRVIESVRRAPEGVDVAIYEKLSRPLLEKAVAGAGAVGE